MPRRSPSNVKAILLGFVVVVICDSLLSAFGGFFLLTAGFRDPSKHPALFYAVNVISLFVCSLAASFLTSRLSRWSHWINVGILFVLIRLGYYVLGYALQPNYPPPILPLLPSAICMLGLFLGALAFSVIGAKHEV